MKWAIWGIGCVGQMIKVLKKKLYKLWGSDWTLQTRVMVITRNSYRLLSFKLSFKLHFHILHSKQLSVSGFFSFNFQRITDLWVRFCRSLAQGLCLLWFITNGDRRGCAGNPLANKQLFLWSSPWNTAFGFPFTLDHSNSLFPSLFLSS